MVSSAIWIKTCTSEFFKEHLWPNIIKSFDKCKLCRTMQNYARINVNLMSKNHIFGVKIYICVAITFLTWHGRAHA